MNSSKDPIFEYTPAEEKVNTTTHLAGVFLSIYIFYSLLSRAISEETWQTVDIKKLTGVVIYGVTLVLLFFASTIYHHAKTEKWKGKLKTFDHICVYFVIAGTFTPFILIKFDANWSILFLLLIWFIAFLGMSFKLLTNKRKGMLSLASYFLMPALCIFVKEPLLNNIPIESLSFLIYGGIALVIGVGFFCYDKLLHNHGIWHVLVLLGIYLHYKAIYIIL